MNRQTNRQARDVFSSLDSWIERQEWMGYDPYDLKGHPFFLRLLRARSSLAQKITRRLFSTIERVPLFTRKAFRIGKAINAKAMGLLLAAYVNHALATQTEKSLEKAKQCAEWLLKNPSPGYSGFCWGYPFDWQSTVFLPKGTPSSVVSATVGDGLWRLADVTDDPRLWDACDSVCTFFLEDLNIDLMDDQTACFSYTPLDHGHVHNANLFVAEFLARVGGRMKNGKYVDMAVRAGNYALREQRPDGSLNYLGTVDDRYNPGHRDCYHSGFETRALWGLWRATCDERFQQAATQYLDFFYRTYIRDDGAVWSLPHSQYPVDIHGCAEALLCPAVLREADPARFDRTWPKVLHWVVENMQNPDGSFAYRKYHDGRVSRIAYLRWGQAWMFRALSEITLAISDKTPQG